MNARSVGISFFNAAMIGVSLLVVVTGTLPAIRAFCAASAKEARLASQRAELEKEIDRLEAETTALKTDYQYNRRLERILYRGGPEPGD